MTFFQVDSNPRPQNVVKISQIPAFLWENFYTLDTGFSKNLQDFRKISRFLVGFFGEIQFRGFQSLTPSLSGLILLTLA